VSPAVSHYAARLNQQLRIGTAALRPGRRPWTGLRILGYHRVADVPHDLSVAPDAFRRQLELVAASGVPVVRLSDVLTALEQPLDGRRIAITFDDGYADFLDHALGALRELGLPATIFVPTALVGRRDFEWYADSPPALSWDELAELERDGLVDVQPHSRTHPWLPTVGDAEAQEEIAGAKADLERRLGVDAQVFCFPAGLYGERELELVRAAGYRAAVTTAPGVNPGGRPSHTLRRTLVYWRDTERIFAAKLDGLLDRPSLAHAIVQRRRSRRAETQ
jgi:peptidoglycan/xylan/chitin deacetylase (PgdA/CDA1 family)